MLARGEHAVIDALHALFERVPLRLGGGCCGGGFITLKVVEGENCAVELVFSFLYRDEVVRKNLLQVTLNVWGWWFGKGG
jgi:hypothetical protein